MKFLATALFILFSINAMASSSLVFPQKNGPSIEIKWLESKAEDSEIDLAWENEGAYAVSNGNICYKGEATEAMLLLEYLNTKDFMGDEFKIQNIQFIDSDKISYEIYDGPNGYIINQAVISICQ